MAEAQAPLPCEPEPENEPDPVPSGVELKLLRSTTTNRDDWLHRGMALLDMDWHCYVRHFERIPKPKDLTSAIATVQYFPFEEHYVLHGKYCQTLRRNPLVVPRTVGPQCPQHSIEEGEQNAVYKAALFKPLCCMVKDRILAATSNIALRHSSQTRVVDTLS